MLPTLPLDSFLSGANYIDYHRIFFFFLFVKGLIFYKLQCYIRISSPKKSRINTREKIRRYLTCV